MQILLGVAFQRDLLNLGLTRLRRARGTQRQTHFGLQVACVHAKPVL